MNDQLKTFRLSPDHEAIRAAKAAPPIAVRIVMGSYANGPSSPVPAGEVVMVSPHEATKLVALGVAEFVSPSPTPEER